MTPADDSADERPLAFAVMNEIAIIDQLASRAFEQVLQPDLTLPQFTVLNHLTRVTPESTPQRLARAFQIAKSAITRTLGHLEGKGYVSVTPDPSDGRGKIVRITTAGAAAHAAAIAAIEPELRALREALPPRTLESAHPLLVAMRRWLDQRRD